MEKENGKNTIVTDKTTTPVFDKKFVFETHIALEVYQVEGRGGFIRFTPPFAKVSHESIRRILPEPGKAQLSVEHGRALAAWCNAAGKPFAPLSGAKSLRNKKELEFDLWALLKPKRTPGVKSWLESGAWQFIVDECGVDPNTTIDSMTTAELESLIVVVKSKI